MATAKYHTALGRLRGMNIIRIAPSRGTRMMIRSDDWSKSFIGCLSPGPGHQVDLSHQKMASPTDPNTMASA